MYDTHTIVGWMLLSWVEEIRDQSSVKRAFDSRRSPTPVSEIRRLYTVFVTALGVVTFFQAGMDDGKTGLTDLTRAG